VGARYYDPQVGLFITRDTHLDQKPYLYCEHDPVNCLDPSGHIVLLVIGLVGGAFAIGSAIKAVGNLQIVRGNREAADNMKHRLQEWSPKTEAGQEYKDYMLSGGLRSWEIGASAKPGAGVVGSSAGTAIGLAGGFSSAYKGLKQLYPKP
jgi:hypothetical protein